MPTLDPDAPELTVAVDDNATTTLTTPVYIPISDAELIKLTIPMLKNELAIRKVSLKGLGTKTKLQDRLKEAWGL